MISDFTETSTAYEGASAIALAGFFYLEKFEERNLAEDFLQVESFGSKTQRVG